MFEEKKNTIVILEANKFEEEDTHDNKSADFPPHSSIAVYAAFIGSNSCTETKMSLPFQK